MQALIRFFSILLPFSCSLFLMQTSHASDADDDEQESPEIVNELFLSDTAYSQEAGEWQITLSPQFEKNEGEERFSLPVEIEYGITDQFQVELEYTPYISVESDFGGDENGQGNIEIGVQYSWADFNGSGLNVAVLYSHEFAEGDRAVIAEAGEEPEDEDNLSFVLALDLDDEESRQAFIQIGSEFEGSESEAYVNLGIYGLWNSWVVSGELNWTDEQSFVTPGLAWESTNGLEFGVGLPIGIDGEADYQLLVNIIYEWE